MKESTLQVVDPLLTEFAARYPQYENGFVASQIFRELPVTVQAGQYRIFVTNYKVVDDRAGLRSKSPEIDEGESASEGTYAARLHSLKAFIPQHELDVMQKPMDLREAKVNKIRRDMLTNWEKRVVALAKTVTTTLNAADWSTDATTIESQVHTAIQTVKDLIGRTPNTIVMPDDIYRKVIQNAELRKLWVAIPGLRESENTKYNLETLFATLFNIQNFLVPSGVEDTTKRNKTASYSDIWGSNCLVAYIEPGQLTTDTLTLGVTFAFKGVAAKTWKENDPEGEWIKEEFWQDEKLVCASAGYMFTNITTT